MPKSVHKGIKESRNQGFIVKRRFTVSMTTDTSSKPSSSKKRSRAKSLSAAQIQTYANRLNDMLAYTVYPADRIQALIQESNNAPELIQILNQYTARKIAELQTARHQHEVTIDIHAEKLSAANSKIIELENKCDAIETLSYYGFKADQFLTEMQGREKLIVDAMIKVSTVEKPVSQKLMIQVNRASRQKAGKPRLGNEPYPATTGTKTDSDIGGNSVERSSMSRICRYYRTRKLIIQLEGSKPYPIWWVKDTAQAALGGSQ